MSCFARLIVASCSFWGVSGFGLSFQFPDDVSDDNNQDDGINQIIKCGQRYVDRIEARVDDGR